MKPPRTGLWTVIVLLLIAFLCPIQAQTTAAASGAATPLSYGVAEEVTLTGTVSSVLMKAAPGMIVGAHLLLATPSGPVDASLGRFGLQGAGAASVAAGQQIEATGILKTIKNKTFFLVRTLKVGGEIYTIRSKHGFPVSPQARQRARQRVGGKGESL
jgi:hypothetical protein